MTSISGELEIMITSSLFLYQPNSSPRDVWREDRSLVFSSNFYYSVKILPKNLRKYRYNEASKVKRIISDLQI